MAMIVYIDMDGVLCDYRSQFKKDLARNPAIEFPQSQYGFFLKLQPMPGGIDAVRALEASALYTPYILTAPSVKNPLSYTEKRVWVETHLGMEFVQRLIISPDKSLLKGDFLIDDITHGRGQESFEGELLHFGSAQYPDWTAIRKRLQV